MFLNSNKLAVNKASCHVTPAVSSHVGHDHNTDASSCTHPLTHCSWRFKESETLENFTELRWSCFSFHVSLQFPQLDFPRHVPTGPAFFCAHATHAPVQEDAGPFRNCCCIVDQEETVPSRCCGVGRAGVDHHEHLRFSCPSPGRRVSVLRLTESVGLFPSR